MAQWEEKLGAILGDPQAMSRIMSIARSLEDSQGERQDRQEAEPEPVSAPQEGPPGPDIDPRLMEVGMRALSAWQGPDDSRTALLQALRPFLRAERHAKLDKAVRITKLSKVVRTALDTFKGGEDDL